MPETSIVESTLKGFVETLRSAASYSYRVPLCVPYWNRRTYFVLLRDIATGRVNEGGAIDCLTTMLREKFSVQAVVLCDSGRTALELGLSLNGVCPGTEVVLPTFCCRSIVEPVLRLRAIPVFADVGPDLNITADTVAEVISERTGAVVVPHMFGNPAEVTEIVELCHSKKIPVIDDAAQALGATHQSRPVGTFGQAGVLSFGKGKVCFGTGGGALLVGEGACRPEELKAVTMTLPKAQGYGTTVRQAIETMVWRRWRKWSLPVGVALKRSGLYKSDSTAGRRGKIDNLSADVATTLLETLEENLVAREKRVELYHERLGSNHDFRLIPHRQGSAHLTQLVELCSRTNRRGLTDKVVHDLRHEGFEVSKSYMPLHRTPEFESYQRAPDLSRIEHTAAELIELPCEPSVRLSEVAAICDILCRSSRVNRP